MLRCYRNPYFVKHEPDVVCTFALTESLEVILARQYRPGPGTVLYDLPGGGIEQDETPLEAAERELIEETGYSGTIEYLGFAWACGYSNRKKHCFLALNCTSAQDPQLDRGEFVRPVLIPVEQFMVHAKKGNAASLDAVLLAFERLLGGIGTLLQRPEGQMKRVLG